MSSYAFQVSFTFSGERHEKVALEYGTFAQPGDEGGGWMVELPAVLRMLQAVERGDASADAIRRTLLAAVATFSERSGCCPDCDYAVDSYARALQSYQTAIEKQQQVEAGMTAESHPYVISSSGKVHAWDCRTEPSRRTIEHPGKTLQEYVHGGRAWDGAGYYMRTAGSATRMTPDELTDWLNRRKVIKRCKLCEPALPGAYGSEASDVEAAGRS